MWCFLFAVAAFLLTKKPMNTNFTPLCQSRWCPNSHFILYWKYKQTDLNMSDGCWMIEMAKLNIHCKSGQPQSRHLLYCWCKNFVSAWWECCQLSVVVVCRYNKKSFVQGHLVTYENLPQRGQTWKPTIKESTTNSADWEAHGCSPFQRTERRSGQATRDRQEDQRQRQD